MDTQNLYQVTFKCKPWYTVDVFARNEMRAFYLARKDALFQGFEVTKKTKYVIICASKTD